MAPGKTPTHSKSNSSAASQSPSFEASDDYSIWLHFDGINTSAPWRLGSYGDDGAISDSDLLELADRFDLSIDLLQTLSRQLGYSLDVDSEVNLVRIKRSKAIERADKELSRAAKLAADIQIAAGKLSKLLAPLDDQFARSKDDSAVLLAAKAQAAELRNTVTAAIAAITTVQRTPGAAAVMAPFNKTHVWDKRRQNVIETCCYVWLEAGRAVTYSSQERTKKGTERGGPFIDFLQAVAIKLTDPPRELSQETIRKDIDRFKKRLAEPDELTTPPDRGIDASR